MNNNELRERGIRLETPYTGKCKVYRGVELVGTITRESGLPSGAGGNWYLDKAGRRYGTRNQALEALLADQS